MAQPIYNSIKDFDHLLGKDASDRLSQKLASWTRGSSNELRSSFMFSYSVEEILKKFDKFFNLHEAKLNSSLTELELSNRSKYGYASIRKPWSEVQAVMDDSFTQPNVADGIFTDLIDQFNSRQYSRSTSLRPISIDLVAQKHVKNSANSGLPFMRKKGLVKQEALRRMSELLGHWFPSVPFWRTQAGNKTRIVFAMDVAWAMLEQCYFQPFLNVEKTWPHRAAINGPEAVDLAVTRLLSSKDGDQSLISIDFSAYDASVSPELSLKAFTEIAKLFQPIKVHGYDLVDVAKHFVGVPMIYPNGKVKNGYHGVPSGSAFTNSIDSLVQAMIYDEWRSKGGINETAEVFQVQGDDGAYVSAHPEALFEAFTEKGLKVNEEKSYVSKDFVVYLQNLFHTDYARKGVIGGIYPIYRALSRVVFPESWNDIETGEIDVNSFNSLRTIMIVENCKHHPLFTEFVQWIMDHDKYALSYDPKAIPQFIEVVEEKNRGRLDHRHSSHVRGIRSFETMKLVNRLS